MSSKRYAWRRTSSTANAALFHQLVTAFDLREGFNIVIVSDNILVCYHGCHEWVGNINSMLLTSVARCCLKLDAGRSLPSESCSESACAATRRATITAPPTPPTPPTPPSPATPLSLMHDSFTWRITQDHYREITNMDCGCDSDYVKNFYDKLKVLVITTKYNRWHTISPVPGWNGLKMI